MKYKLIGDLVDDKNILSYVFLECVPKEMLELIAAGNKGKTPKQVEARKIDVELFIDGKSVNPKNFFQLMVDQYDEQLKKTATKMLKEQLSGKFRELQDKLSGMEEIVNSWADEITWQAENPLIKKSKKSV